MMYTYFIKWMEMDAYPWEFSMKSRDLESNQVCNFFCKYNNVIIMFIIATEKS